MPSSSSTPFDHPHSPSSPSHANNGHHHSSSPATPSSSSLKIKLSKRPRPEDAAPTPPAYLSQVDQPGPSRLSPSRSNGNGHHEYTTSAAASPPASSSAAEWTPPVVPTPPWPAQKKKRVAPPVDIHEGLTKLIQSFVKKDAYGFFLAPVDEAEVPGYRTVIRNPMDLGTMEKKVEHDQYGDVASFRDDFLLVTNNAKLFNPPGSIYHTQAQKLEDYGVKAIQRLEDRGVRSRGEESSPDPLEASLSETYENSFSFDASEDISGDARPKKPKLKGRASGGSQRGGKKASKAVRSKTSSRASSRPLVPSALGRPPLAASPSPASGSEDGDAGSDEEDDDGDESMQAGTSHYHRIKREDGEGSDEDDEDDDDEDDDEEGGSMTRRGSSAHRNSQTPMPGGGSAPRRKMMPIRGRNFPPRKQPLVFAETAAAAIDKVIAESNAKSVDIDLGEAALRHRAETRKQDFKPTAYLPDGSLDLESMRFSERNDLLAPLGITMDPATGLKPIYLCDTTVPELSSTHPLHPDAQRHQTQLVRPAPYDALRLTTSERALPKEATGSHYEHGMPATQQRLPMFLPTASVTPATAAAAAASSSSNGAAGSSSTTSKTTTSLGSVPTTLNPIPHRWPHPLWSVMPEYEPHPHLDPLYPPPEPEDPTAAKSKHWRSKDFEREQYGFATLGDWTYPHAHYSRVWDGVGDLAVWKDVEGATIGAAPVDPTVLSSSSNANGGAPPPPGASSAGQPLAPGALYGLDGQLGHYERWDWARLTVLRDTLMWEDREATCRAVGVNAPDRSTERALLEKLGGMDEAADEAGIGQGSAASGGGRGGEEDGNNDGGAASSSSTLRATAPAVPAHERASQADSSARFLQGNVWGGFEAELWASSIERFVKGAAAGVVVEEDEEDVDNDEASAAPAAIKMDVDADHQQEQKAVKLEEAPQEGNNNIPATPADRLMQAISNDMILDRDLYKWVRDSLVVPVTKNRYGAVIARTGELIEELELRQKCGQITVDDEEVSPTDAANGDSTAAAADHPERILTASNVSYLVAHMPLIWARLRLVRLLLDRPMSLINADDAPPFILRDKEGEWGRQPPIPSEEGEGEGEGGRTTRYADDEWTTQRVKECLGEYARALMELDGRIRERRRKKPRAAEEVPNIDEGAEQQQQQELDDDDATTRRVKEELRLALLALARFAPSNQIRA